MKKFIAALAAAAVLAPTLCAAPAFARDDRRPHQGHTVVTKKVTYKSFRKGDRFDRRYARNYQVVDYHRYRHLKARHAAITMCGPAMTCGWSASPAVSSRRC